MRLFALIFAMGVTTSAAVAGPPPPPGTVHGFYVNAPTNFRLSSSVAECQSHIPSVYGSCSAVISKGNDTFVWEYSGCASPGPFGSGAVCKPAEGYKIYHYDGSGRHLYTKVESADTHGYLWVYLPGCYVVAAYNGGAESGDSNRICVQRVNPDRPSRSNAAINPRPGITLPVHLGDDARVYHGQDIVAILIGLRNPSVADAPGGGCLQDNKRRDIHAIQAVTNDFFGDTQFAPNKISEDTFVVRTMHDRGEGGLAIEWRHAASGVVGRYLVDADSFAIKAR